MGRIPALLILAGLCQAAAAEPRAHLRPGPAATIATFAAGSSCAAHRWGVQGRAPPGFIQGIALVFARSVCRADQPEVRLAAAAKPGPGAAERRTDALGAYDGAFRATRMANEADGLDTLRHTYVLLIGLGMRESTGRYCAGRDGAGHKTDARTAEAGLFQTSWGTSRSHPALPNLFARYEADRSRCLRRVFGRGVTCSAHHARNWGFGEGARWQQLTKTCPAFATEYAAIVVRTIGGAPGAFGPIRRRTVALRPECDRMLWRIQSLVRSDPAYCAALQGASQ